METTVGLLLIGDELLSAKVEDTNGRYALQRLRVLGVEVREVRIVGDDLDQIVESVNALRERNTWVFTSGGIGPTHDDVTMQAMAAAFGVSLYEEAKLKTIIDDHYGGREDNPWCKMARIPEGCHLVFHEDTRWPSHQLGNVYVLPGIPSVFRRMFDHLSRVLDGQTFYVETLFLDTDEGVVAPILGAADARFGGVRFGSYPERFEQDYRVRLTLESRDKGAVCAAGEWLSARFSEVIVRREKVD